MKLYSYWRSSCSWRVRIGLHYKGIPFEYVPVHLLEGEQASQAYLGKNPLAQVPLLELDDGRLLGQSLAILGYLEAAYPGSPLLPTDPYLRAKTWQLAELVNSGIQPLQNVAVTNQVKQLGSDEKAWTKHWISRGLVALEAEAQHTAGKFLVGDAPSLADLCLVPQLYGARRFAVDLGALPTLVRIEAACAALPAFIAGHADNQIDAVKT